MRRVRELASDGGWNELRLKCNQSKKSAQVWVWRGKSLVIAKRKTWIIKRLSSDEFLLIIPSSGRGRGEGNETNKNHQPGSPDTTRRKSSHLDCENRLRVSAWFHFSMFIMKTQWKAIKNYDFGFIIHFSPSKIFHSRCRPHTPRASRR